MLWNLSSCRIIITYESYIITYKDLSLKRKATAAVCVYMCGL